MHRATDERDPLVALFAQVGHGELATLDVVDTDTAPRGIGAAVDEDDRHPAAGVNRELGRLLPNRGDQDAAHPLFEQQIEIVRLACDVAIAVADVERHAGGPGDLLDALGHIGEERVRRVEDDVGDGPAVPRTQLTTGLVADEAELLDGAQHLVASWFADPVGSVQDVRHGADGHACPSGDVLDAR